VLLAIPLVIGVVFLLSAFNVLRVSSPMSQAPESNLELLPAGTTLASPGKVVVLNFFASWCPPCRDEAPALRTVSNRIAGLDDVLMVGVIFQDDQSSANDYMSDYDLAYPAVADPGGDLARAFRVGGIPKTFVIDGAGRIVLAHFGAIRPEILLGAIEEARSH